MQVVKRDTFLALLLVPGILLAADPSAVGSMKGHPAAAPHISMPASAESVKQLLQITGTRKLLDDNLRQVDERVTEGLQRAYAGRNLTPEQEAIIVRTRDKIAAVVKESISWEAMEPLSIRIYREALTQDELDGMLKFYKTPAGEAVIRKLPRLAQDMSLELQRMLQSMTPKLMAISKESEEDMKLAAPMFDPFNPSDAHSSPVAPSTIPTPLEPPSASPSPGVSPRSPDR